MNLPSFYKNSSSLLRLIIVLIAIFFMFVVVEGYNYLNKKEKIELTTKQQVKQEASTVVNRLNNNFKDSTIIVHQLANQLSLNKTSRTNAVDLLKNTLENNPNFFGVGVAYVPDREGKLYAPYCVRRKNKIEVIYDEQNFDYTKSEWFVKTLGRGPSWHEPYFGKSTGVMQAKYAVPFYYTDSKSKIKKLAGVVYINYSLANLKDMMSSMELGKSGYGFIISKMGILISHPVDDYVESHKKIYELASDFKCSNFNDIYKKIISGDKGIIECRNKTTGHFLWIVYQPINTTGWTLVSVFDKNETFSKDDSIYLKHQLFKILIGIIVIIFLLSVLIFKAYLGEERQLWKVVIVSSVLLSSGICFLWSFENENGNNVQIVDKSGLNNFLDKQVQLASKLHKDKPVFIPTGIFIQSLNFSNASSISVTGYIWQKYFDRVHDDITRGIIFPANITDDLENISPIEVYRRKEGNIEIIGCYFTAQLHQSFDYSKFPLDKKTCL